jgi:hypothetical protein
MALGIKSILIPFAAAAVFAVPSSSPDHSETDAILALATQAMCSAQNRQTVRNVVDSQRRNAFLAEAKKSYQDALQQKDPAAIMDSVNAVRFSLGIANGLDLNDPVDPQSYGDIGTTKEAVLAVEQKAALAMAQNMATRPRDTMTIFTLRSIQSYLRRAGFDVEQGKGFDQIGTTASDFNALKREYALKDARNVALEIKSGQLPKWFGRYQMEKNMMDAGYGDNVAWYAAIGTTTEEFRKNVQAICGQNDDCLIKEPGKNVLSHHLRGM